MLGQLSNVPYEETKLLLKKFFQRVIDLKEIEHQRIVENSELKVQVEEQSRMIDELKQALNASSIDLERRMLVDHQQNRSNSKPSNKATGTNVITTTRPVSQLSDSQNKIAMMEQEISLYKDKLAQLNQLKANPNHHYSGDQNNNAFYLKNESINSMAASNGGMMDSLVENSNQSMPNLVKVVKMPRKDLRRLTEEEVLKRSLTKKDTSAD